MTVNTAAEHDDEESMMGRYFKGLVHLAILTSVLGSMCVGVGSAESSLPVESVELGISETITITDATTLTATVLPLDATDRSLVWSSSDLSIAAVDQNGTVTPLKTGHCAITAKAADGSNRQDTCGVVCLPFDSIESYAFYNGKIGRVIIPNTIVSIKNSAFSGCSVYGELVIPDSVVSIDDHAFEWCTGFTGLSIGNGITEIKRWVFEFCTGLSGNLIIPESVTVIGREAFAYCSNLSGALVIPDSTVSIHNSAFRACKGFTSLVLSSNLNVIGPHAFLDCSGLSGNLVIPSSITYINYGAFKNCSSLDKIYVLAKDFNLSGANDEFLNSANVFYGYSGTPIENYARANGLTFHAFGVVIEGKSSLSTAESVALETEITVPPGASNRLTWASSDTAVVSVDENGVLTANGPGSAEIVVTMEYDSALSATHHIDVRQSVVSITLTPASTALNPGSNSKITAKVLPENSSDITLQWSCIDEGIATVDQSGLVTAIAPGTVTITASAQDGSGVSGSTEITVNKLQYDMSGVAWDYSGDFTYDGTEKSVILKGPIPEGLVPMYQGNNATETGSYAASVTFTYDETNYEAPVMPDLNWAIEPAADPKLPGDANGDDSIDILDLVSIIDYIVSGTAPKSLENANANGDESVDILDLVWIIDQIVIS